MKKILLASTALVLSAAAADAQALRIGGYGRMGIVHNEANAVDTVQEHRLRLNFSVAVEADNGLSFGAFTRAQMSNDVAGSFAASRVWVEAAGLRLTFGNVAGAISQIGYTGAVGIGYTGGTFFGGEGYLDNLVQNYTSGGNPVGNRGANNRALLSYSFGDLSVAVSNDRNGWTEFAAAYTYGEFSFALGATDGYTGDGVVGAYVAGDEIYTISGSYDGGIWNAGLIYVQVGDLDAVTLTGSVELAGGTLNAYVGRGDINSVANETDFGIGYMYGLGGGASIGGGYEQVNNYDRANFGVIFNF